MGRHRGKMDYRPSNLANQTAEIRSERAIGRKRGWANDGRWIAVGMIQQLTVGGDDRWLMSREQLVLRVGSIPRTAFGLRWFTYRAVRCSNIAPRGR